MTTRYIGTVIRLHRKAAGMSRADLARLSGVGKTMIYDLEHGKETVQLRGLLLILDALSIKLRFESRVMESLKELIERGEIDESSGAPHQRTR
ncbi:MAG: helix-turn-helix domain-containing protein [Rhodothermia bacterium]